MLKTITVLAMISLAACAGPSDKNHENNGWKLNNDNPDMGGDGGRPDGGPSDSGPDMPPTQSVEFRLVNGSGAPVFAYHAAGSTNPCGQGAFVEVLEGGRSQSLQSDCTMCDCGDENCAVCAIDCAPGVEPDGVQLGEGDARTFTWDGLFREQQSNADGTTCRTDRAPLTPTLTARFCWGHGFEPFDDLQRWGDITDIECQDVEFDVGDRVVEVEIEPTTRENISFEMTNSSMQDLYASIGIDSPCIVDEWLRISQGDDPLLVTMPCGECACNEVNAGSMCPLPCPAACAAPTPELYIFPVGDLRRFDWNRTHYVRDEVDGVMCLDDRLVAGEVTATFCWATGFDEATFSLVGETCESITFDPYRENQIRYDITTP